jgi:preprotein translocase subunit Sec61beta
MNKRIKISAIIALMVPNVIMATDFITSGEAKYSYVYKGNWKYLKIDANGADKLNIKISRLDADVDLYVKKGNKPDFGYYDCRPYLGGTKSEECNIDVDPNDIVYMGIQGYKSSEFKIVATLSSEDTTPPVDDTKFITSGVPKYSYVYKGNWKYLKIDANGADKLKVRMSRLDADVNLYVKIGEKPNSNSYDCRPYLGGTSSEECYLDVDPDDIVYMGIKGLNTSEFKILSTLTTEEEAIAPIDESLLTTVIDDNFDTYDNNIWMKSDWANGDPFYSGWCPEQIAFASGKVTLSLEEKSCHNLTHASGEYRTKETYKYGRYTANFKASNINGVISSFFTYTGPSEGTEWDEIDVEILGKDATKLQVNYWRNGKEHPVIIDLGFDASEAMHTYSFLWHPEYITWYVDDILVHTVRENNLNNDDSLPMNESKIMMNIWAGTGIDSWSGSYTDGTNAQSIYDSVKFESLAE